MVAGTPLAASGVSALFLLNHLTVSYSYRSTPSVSETTSNVLASLSQNALQILGEKFIHLPSGMPSSNVPSVELLKALFQSSQSLSVGHSCPKENNERLLPRCRSYDSCQLEK